MKNYEEMSADVFRKIESINQKKQYKTKIITRTLIYAVCFCLTLLTAIGISNGQLYNPSKKPYDKNSSFGNKYNKIISAEPFVYLCSTENNDKSDSDIIQSKTPYDAKIYLNFLSIKDMDEKQIESIFDDYSKKVKNYVHKSSSNPDVNALGSVLREENHIITTVATNFFKLKLDNIENIKQILVSNTSKYGQIDVHGIKENSENYRFLHGKELVIEKEEITERLSFSWNYYRLYDYFKENQNPSYNDFNDKFNFTVEYIDGTKITADIDILFNESGEADIICNNYKMFIA